jgi:uncharacterized heparinase superfamily protein
MAAILPAGLARRMIGARMFKGPREIETNRHETGNGWLVDAGHDGYAAAFGVRHERRIVLSPNGSALTGVDRLLPLGDKPHKDTPYAVRFHIHPDVRVSTSQSGAVLLKLPNGEGWRFRAGTQPVLEESIYVAGDIVRRSEQIVLAGSVKDQPVELAWIFEHIEAG